MEHAHQAMQQARGLNESMMIRLNSAKNKLIDRPVQLQLEKLHLQDSKLATLARLFFGYIGGVVLVLFLALSLGLTLQVVYVVLEEPKSGHHEVTLFLIPVTLMWSCFFMSEFMDLLMDAVHKPPLVKIRAFLLELTPARELRTIDAGLLIMIPLFLILPWAFTGIDRENPGKTIGGTMSGALLSFMVLTIVQIVGKVGVTLSETKLRSWLGQVELISVGATLEAEKDTGDGDSEDEEEAQISEAPVVEEVPDDSSEEETRETFGRTRTLKALGGILISSCAIIILASLLNAGLLNFIIAFLIYFIAFSGLIYSVHFLLPRLLGTKFLSFGAFLIGLAIVTAISTRSSIMSDEYAPLEKVRKAIEPPVPSQGNIFTPPPVGTVYNDSLISLSGNKYPVCDFRWGKVFPPSKRLTILDLNVFAAASYYDKNEDIMSVILNATDGTDIAGGIVLEDVEPAKIVGRWVVIKIPEAKTRVFAIRGTKILKDALADAHMWATIKILQMSSRILPILNLFPVGWFQWYIGFVDVDKWLGNPNVWDAALEAARVVKQQSQADGYDVVVTGHSLGGGIAQIIGAAVGIPTLTWSAVGVLYSLERFKITLDEVIRNVVNVKPLRDVIPDIDVQPGFTQTIDCKTGTIISCHSVRKSGCEIYHDCGDPRGRDMSANCNMVLGR